jgi:hypothetical protein
LYALHCAEVYSHIQHCLLEDLMIGVRTYVRT